MIGSRRLVALATAAAVAALGLATTVPATATAASVAPGADHNCIVGTAPRVDWSKLSNPVLSYPTVGAKDEAIIYANGRWHMIFSEITNNVTTPGLEHWDVATATSRDLEHWSAPVPWPAQRGEPGEVSPDIVRAPNGTYVVTYDTVAGEHYGAKPTLFYRTSTNLVTWSAPHGLAPSLGALTSNRMIDPALAWTGHGLILGFKAGANAQHFEIGWSKSGSLNGPWQLIGTPDIFVVDGTVENYEFLTVGGVWHLVATSNNLDEPWIFTLAANPAKPASWLLWRDAYELQIPSAPWDSGNGLSSLNFEHANSAFLCQPSATGGWYYLFYAGSAELTQFGGWGHAKIGIARSKNLVTWSVPPN